MTHKRLEQLSREDLIEHNLQLHAQIQKLDHELQWLKRQLFGSKSERFIPNDAQLTLPLGVDPTTSPDNASTETITYDRKKNAPNTQGHGRGEMPTHLPFVDTIIEPDEDVSDCDYIGDEVSWEYEYIGAKLLVRRYIRKKYARKQGDGVAVAPMPERVIDKGNAGASLIAQLIVDKYVYHLPLDRQRKRFRSEFGVTFAESTLCGWVRAGCFWLEPLHTSLAGQVQACDYLQADETPVPVLVKDGRGKTHRGYFWVYYDPIGKRVVFDYQKSRSRAGPNDFLANFKGVLQVDGYSGYDEVVQRKDVVRAGCMAHVRRYFEQALDVDRPRAEYAIERIKKLFALERQYRDENLSHEQILAARQSSAAPIMEELGRWLKATLTQVLPKSAIGKAITYALSQWDGFKPYLADGRIELSNNLVENAIRPVALGRKNYLFKGSHDAAQRAAIIYSLVATAHLHGHDHVEYLRTVLSELPKEKANQIDKFLPHLWKANPEK